MNPITGILELTLTDWIVSGVIAVGSLALWISGRHA